MVRDARRVVVGGRARWPTFSTDNYRPRVHHVDRVSSNDASQSTRLAASSTSYAQHGCAKNANRFPHEILMYNNLAVAYGERIYDGHGNGRYLGVQ